MTRIRVLSEGRVSILDAPGCAEPITFRPVVVDGELRVTDRTGGEARYSDAQVLRLRKEVLAAQPGLALAVLAEPPPGRGRPRVVTSHEARRAADAYRSALTEGSPNQARNPREVVAEELGCSVNTADDYIKLARRRGFLEPADKRDSRDA